MVRSKITTLAITFLLLPFLYFSFIQKREMPGDPDAGKSNSYGSPVHLADLENHSIKESSGIAASRRHANLYWTHNDSGDKPFIYAFDRKGSHRGVWSVTGAKARDWEDIALGPGPVRGRSYIYIGDIGDNSRKREEIIVYRVAEPELNSSDATSTVKSPRSTGDVDAIRLRYPDGKHDAEALMIHPSTGDLYIVTKVMGGTAGVYKLKAPLPANGVSTLVRMGEVRFPNSLGGFITGGDISPSGRRIILCDYLTACEMVLPEGREAAFDDIWKQPLAQVNLGTRRQGEAICYRADESALLVTSEGLPCPLIEIPQNTR
jgi:hypothetical protein